ncbi:MAG: hypothetical protein ACXVA2_16365, partial [Mucilaginibacter sp.]
MKKELSQNGSDSSDSSVSKDVESADGTGSGSKIDRRKFIKVAATGALAFSIIPRHVLGGINYIAPSDKLTFAYV